MMDKVQGEQTNSVDGEYTPSEALKIMLAGTSLEIMQETEIKGFVVGRKASSLQREMAGDPNLQPKSDHNPSGESGKNESKMNHRTAKLITLLLTLFGVGSTASEGQGASPAAPAPLTAPSPTAAQPEQAPLILDQYVVTAAAGGKVTQLNSSFDVSIVPHQQIVTTTAAGPAGLLDSVPGFYGESSGGEVNQNLSSDGLRGAFYTYISLQEDGLPVMYNGFFSEFQIRPDSTYERVDVIRNGPSGVYAPQAAAAIVNFISRMPAVDEGDATLSFTSEGNKRLDYFYGGPVGAFPGWSASVGGYYEIGQGERPVGYNVTKGGETKVSLAKNFPGGSLTITYKNIDAHVPFYVDTPVAENASGALHAIPGFNPRTDTLYSPELENGTLHPPVGQGTNQALDEGNGNSDLTNQLTVKLDKDLGSEWKLSNNFRLAHINYIDDDDRSAGNSALSAAPSYLAANLSALQNYAKTLPGSPVVTSDALVQVSTGQTVSNPAGLNGNGLLLVSDNFKYHATFDNLMDDLRLTWQTDQNTLDLGMLYMDVNGTSLGETGNDELIDIRNHAHLYDVVGRNSTGGVVDHLTDNGVLQFDSINAGYYGNGSEEVISSNYYLNDQFQVTPKLRIDAGFRYEQTDYTTQAENVAYGAPLPMAAGNPTVIADQADGSYGTGTFANGSNNGNDSAWSIGANYMLTDHLSIYARSTKDFDEGVQDFNVFGGQNGNPSRSGFTTLRFNQAGIRFENPQFAVSATGFQSVDDNFPEAVTAAGSGAPGNIFVNIKSTGVDFETVWKPINSFLVSVSGVVQHSALKGIPAGQLSSSGVVNGDQVDRLPDTQIQFKPTYYFHFSGDYFNKGNMYVVATYYGQRYGDLANTEKLGIYTNWGAGLNFYLTRDLSCDIVGDNLTNATAFTEGNPRGGSNLNAGGQAYVLARAIWGRNFKISCTLHF